MLISRVLITLLLMIQLLSLLKVVDNTGVKVLKVIGVHKRKSGIGRIGDMVTASVKEAEPGAKAKKGDVVRALIVRTRAETLRADGRMLKFSDNAAVLLASDKKPIGTRISGPLPLELRTEQWIKILSLSANCI